MVKNFPDQKEYLKKYLCGSKPKSKKKKSINRVKGVKLIDDDEAVKSFEVDDEDLILEGEEAPQIILGEGVEASTLQNSLNKWRNIVSNDQGHERSKFLNNFSTIDSPSCRNDEKDNAFYKKNEINDDIAIPHKQTTSSLQEINDLSPLRKHDSSTAKNTKDKYRASIGKLKREKSLPRSPSIDLSPQRKSSPPRRRKSRDLSPIRRKDNRVSSSRRSERDEKIKPSINKSYRDKILSPYLKKYESITKRKSKSQDLSPSRQSQKSRTNQKNNEKRIKTMADGNSTGLKSATELKLELEEIHKTEEDIFKKSSAHMGEYAEPIIRSNVRNRITVDEQMKMKKKERENEKKQEVYTRWGKGLKQIEDHNAKIEDHQYESSKPLARYADDKDLDNMLKNIERVGDPMLEYLRNKNEKEKESRKQPALPIYKGNYPENRFGIRPGYRWDGVNRSNGYEQKYFDKQNAKVALQEEAYRYSTEDM